MSKNLKVLTLLASGTEPFTVRVIRAAAEIFQCSIKNIDSVMWGRFNDVDDDGKHWVYYFLDDYGFTKEEVKHLLNSDMEVGKSLVNDWIFKGIEEMDGPNKELLLTNSHEVTALVRDGFYRRAGFYGYTVRTGEAIDVNFRNVEDGSTNSNVYPCEVLESKSLNGGGCTNKVKRLLDGKVFHNVGGQAYIDGTLFGYATCWGGVHLSM